MMQVLDFCRDGVLRVREGVRDRAMNVYYPIHLPLAAYPPEAILSYLQAEIELEDGIQVEEIFQNLQPFARFLSPISGVDLAQVSCENGNRSDRSLLLKYHATLDAVEIFDHDEDLMQRIPGSRFYTLAPLQRRDTGRLILDNIGWKMVVLEDREYDVGGGSIEEFRGCIVRLAPTWMLHCAPGMLLSDQACIDGSKLTLDCPRPTLLDTILLGFCRSFGPLGTFDAEGDPVVLDAEGVRACVEDSIRETDELREEERFVRESGDVAAYEALIRSELEERERVKQERFQREPLSPRSLRLLDAVERMNDPWKSLIRYPKGRPGRS